MKPVTEVQQETAEVLGNAVAEVARRAIQPELEPFKQSLASLLGELEGHAETLGEQVGAEKKAIEVLNKQLGEVVATGKSQVAAAAETLARVQELRGRLDVLAGDLTATRGEQVSAVAALNALHDEVVGWMQVSREQAELLSVTLSQAEAVAITLDERAQEFSEFGAAFAEKVDTHARSLLEAAAATRGDLAGVGAEILDAVGRGETPIRVELAALAEAETARSNAILDAVGRGKTPLRAELAALAAAEAARGEEILGAVGRGETPLRTALAALAVAEAARADAILDVVGRGEVPLRVEMAAIALAEAARGKAILELVGPGQTSLRAELAALGAAELARGSAILDAVGRGETPLREELAATRAALVAVTGKVDEMSAVVARLASTLGEAGPEQPTITAAVESLVRGNPAVRADIEHTRSETAAAIAKLPARTLLLLVGGGLAVLSVVSIALGLASLLLRGPG